MMPPLTALAGIPLKVAIPAAATTLAYLNARWSVSHDVALGRAFAHTVLQPALAERNDRLNLFYLLEYYALNPKLANDTWVVYNGRSWTFHEGYETVLRYGHWLKTVHGVKPKEIVAMDFMNSSTFIFLMFGLWSIGAVPAFINYNLSGKPLTHSVKASTARLLFVDEDVRGSFPQEQLDIFTSPDFHEDKGPMTVVFFTPDVEAQILQTQPVREDDRARQGVIRRDMAILIYTSGTTGLPKPAIVSWAKCYAGGYFSSSYMGLKQSDRFYTCMPLYHSSATLMCFCACLTVGCTCIIGRKFSARNFWKEVRENNATAVQYVGETMRYLLAVPPEVDPVTGEDLDKKHNVRIIFGNGLRPDVWNKVKERFNIPTVCEFYASTEGSSATWNLSSNSHSAGAIGRNGAIARFVFERRHAIVAVDHENQQPWRDPKTGLCKAVPRGEPGELLLALDAKDTEAMFQGYFKNNKATEDKIIRDVLTKGDAYFRTGDMIRWDNNGLWYFSDRMGDTFRWRSENVSTSEVSEVLGAHPEVHEANVYGVALPHHDGRAGCAAIVFRHQAQNTDPSSGVIGPSPQVLSDVASYALKNLPKYAVPIFLRVTPEMQATGNNKQQKHVLQKEGVDPSKVNAKDKLYWLRGATYVPFRQKDWERLNAGQVRL